MLKISVTNSNLKGPLISDTKLLSTNKVCLDTDFLVDFLRNKKPKDDFLDHEEKLILSTTHINLFELYIGAYKSDRIENVRSIEELQQRLWLLNLSVSSVQEAGRIHAMLEKNGTNIDFRDLLIGCIAKTEGWALKTNNKKHFERIPGLQII